METTGVYVKNLLESGVFSTWNALLVATYKFFKSEMFPNPLMNTLCFLIHQGKMAAHKIRRCV